MKRNGFFATILICICTFIPAKIEADYFDTPMQVYTPSSINMINSLVMVKGNIDDWNKKDFGDETDNWDEDERSQPVLSYDNLNYKTSLARRKQNVAQFLARVRKQDPKTADSLQLQMTQTDMFSALNQALVSKGLSLNNYADAQAVLWISMWEASRGLLRDGSAQETQAVRDQVVWLWRSSPEIAAMTDAQKQAVSEELYLNAVLIAGSLETVKNDPKQLRAYAKIISQQSAAMGLDLSQMMLTEDGFVFRK